MTVRCFFTMAVKANGKADNALIEDTRETVPHGRSSIAINIPAEARKIMGIEKGQLMCVQIHQNKIVYRPVEGDFDE